MGTVLTLLQGVIVWTEETSKPNHILFASFLLVLFFSCPSIAQDESSNMALNVEAFDMPGDAGGSIGLRWPVLGGETSTIVYRVSLSEQETGEFTQIAEFPADTHYETDISGPWWVWGAKRKDVHFFQVESTTDIRLDNDKTYFF